jgi:hypothetical protein
MRYPLENRYFAKILVEGDEDATFLMGLLEDFPVSWVFGPISCPKDVVPFGLKVTLGATPDTGIQ